VTRHARHVVAAAVLLAAATACSRSHAPSESTPAIRMTIPDGAPGYVEVTGLSEEALDDFDGARFTAEQWSSLLRVSVSADAPAMLGTYAVDTGALRFTPAFPFDPGRSYAVRFDMSRLPGAPPAAAAITAEVSRPAPAGSPSTVVMRIYPGGDVPENLLRMYIEFSAPMGRRPGTDFVRLVDDRGKAVEGPFLPLDYEFWSPDRRRLTLFFDPGRVKDGILPNRQMGPVLEAGRTYTLVVSPEWRDGQGMPLKEGYRHVLRVGPSRTRPLDPATWTVRAPSARTRDPLVVSFPAALDHGLLVRGLGVRAGGTVVAGDVSVSDGETRWTFTPDEPWRAGTYDLLALSILEDVAGNQIGRAFEVDNFDTVDKSPDPQTTLIPFIVRAAKTTE
jgi:hypothetical protein